MSAAGQPSVAGRATPPSKGRWRCQWTCAKCGNLNRGRRCNTTSCGATRSESRWQCATCGNENDAHRLFCGNIGCQVARSDLTATAVAQYFRSAAKAKASATVPPVASDISWLPAWTCNLCGNYNYPLRAKCNGRRCGVSFIVGCQDHGASSRGKLATAKPVSSASGGGSCGGSCAGSGDAGSGGTGARQPAFDGGAACVAGGAAPSHSLDEPVCIQISELVCFQDVQGPKRATTAAGKTEAEKQKKARRFSAALVASPPLGVWRKGRIASPQFVRDQPARVFLRTPTDAFFNPWCIAEDTSTGLSTDFPQLPRFFGVAAEHS